MKPRRIALLTVAAGCVVVAVLVVLNWPTVRDHAEAWWFQSVTQTETVLPKDGTLLGRKSLFQDIADCLGRPVILDPARHVRTVWIDGRSPKQLTERGHMALTALRKQGWHVVDQRFPQRAYVVVGYPERNPVALDEAARAVKRQMHDAKAVQEAIQRMQQREQRARESRQLKHPAPPRKAFEKDA